jgi:hypothetical protein
MEIARLDGIPDATVRSRIKRGLDELRVRLDAERGGDRAAWMATLLPWSRTGAATATTAVVGGVAAKWIVFAAAGVVAIAGAAVVAARSKSGDDVRTEVAVRPRADPSDGSVPSPVNPTESADRVVDGAMGSASPVAVNDPASVAAASVPRWRIEGKLLGLDPATPWTGTIRIEPIAGSVVVHEVPTGDEAHLVGDRFAADLSSPPFAPGTSAPWRAWQVTATDPAYVDVRTLIDALDDHGVPRAPCTLHVDLKTRPSSHLHGRVVDEAGAPVPGMDLIWWHARGDEPWIEEQRTKADAVGRYAMEVPCIGLRDVSTWIDPEKPCDLLDAHLRVELHAGSDVDLADLVMRRGVEIRGIVVDRDRGPEPGALVSASPMYSEAEVADPAIEWVSFRTATSDRAGAFVLRGLRRGRWSLAIQGLADVTSHPTVGNTKQERSFCVDAPADSVEIEDPLCRVELRLRVGAAAAARLPFTIQGEEPASGDSSCLGGTADDAGTFRFVAVPGFRYQLFCDRPDVEPTPHPIEIAVSDRRRVVDVAFEARHPRASLALALHDPAGGTVGRAWIRLESVADPANAWKEAMPEPLDGLFVVENVDPGRYHATVRAGGGHFGCAGFYEEETFEVDLATPARIERSLTLRPTGRLRLFAVDADGKHVRANVAVVDEVGRRFGVALAYEAPDSSKSSRGDTLDQPAFLVPPPPPGRYRVEFTADGFFPQSLDARVVAGETTDVTATLIRR